MRELKTIFNFEFKGMLFKRAVMMTTVILAIIAFAISFLPLFFNSDSEGNTEGDSLLFSKRVGFYFANTQDYLYLEDILAHEDYIEYRDPDALRNAIEAGDIQLGFAVHALDNYTLYAKDMGLYDINQIVFENLVTSVIKTRNLEAKGIDPLAVMEAENITIHSETVFLGKDASQGMIVGYIFLFVMYMLILIEGSSVSSSVAREKDSRTMELLITSTQPKYLILGKVFAASLVGVVQIASIILAFMIGYMINKGSYPAFLVLMLESSISWDLALIFIAFAISGYMLYLFIYAALGSLVSKVEDVSASVAPITFLFIGAYLLATLTMSLPEWSVVRISSFIPFFSIFTMPLRALLTSVSWFEISISLLLIVMTTIGIAYLSIYIYRYGSLNYGNKIKLREVFRSLRKVDQ